ncbi:hypothetical protein AB0G87_07165 [Streptomyces asoensis]|uniref:hypothetical protein n=1 Tax=Streptomyces asoensis TaxID=249586 RepID=UPI0033E4645C
MDRRQLCEALDAAGVPAGLYEIAGCPGSPDVPRPQDRLFLERQAGAWVVGVRQRGARTVWERFPDEDQACRRLYAELTDAGPRPVPPSPEETRRLLRADDSADDSAGAQDDRGYDSEDPGRKPD